MTSGQFVVVEIPMDISVTGQQKNVICMIINYRQFSISVQNFVLNHRLKNDIETID